jgi:hypothetical protein
MHANPLNASPANAENDHYREAFDALDGDTTFRECAQACFDAGWKDGFGKGWRRGFANGRTVLSYSWIGIYSLLLLAGGMIVGAVVLAGMIYGGGAL